MPRPAIGIILPRMDDYCITSALRGIGQVLAPHDYEVLIGHSQGSGKLEAEIAGLLMAQDVRGVIASLSPETKDLAHFKAFTSQGVPVVFLDQRKKMEGCTSVGVNMLFGGRIAAEHLIRQGCRRIAIFTSDLHHEENALRYAGFLQALRSAGVPFSGDQLILGKMNEWGGSQAAARLLRLDPIPDGLFITSDLAAAFCIAALKDAGMRVPEDLAVVGFNNDPAVRLVNPSLTTIDYPGAEIGRIAADRLLDYLSDSPAPQPGTIIVPAALIPRASSMRMKTHAGHAASPC